MGIPERAQAAARRFAYSAEMLMPWYGDAQRAQAHADEIERIQREGVYPELSAFLAEAEANEPVPYELTELGAAQAVADQMTEREVGPGFLASLYPDMEAEV